ncbi:TIGR02281 family clan AA aspartic protease [Sinorhizobium terangae]|uniref:TIGR02281 family clan AA aspartic protease n=1 Tax=Sinorhizobium terangae TaxID=110322 RepID=A0A6N7LH74_SINTE|nr:TIGR02281 family clan AA aspartic protease [Sinorhizobium terangae]MBB4187571.1 aspartyl protease family protein [Sinorhizobium terangae]MQX17137.1 TIGR02281 family clan AA aspartic protease [Sinorhizobium terangae]WFU49333.1 TIGR02281 family clan AA aspartic protease [Sinorhizobium terangae]
MNRLIFLLAILAVGLALLIFNHDSGETFGINNEDFGRLVALGAMAALLSAAILRGRGRLGEGLRQIFIWFLIALALIAVYVYRFELQSVADRLLAGLMPGRAMVITDSEGQQEVVLHRRLDGHFAADAMINGHEVSMLVDTGASSIALTYEDAERIGLDPANLSYTVTVLTANGRTLAAPVTLSDIAIGPIERQNIRAMVAAEGKLDRSLLGMSFLSTLDFLQMRTDQLRLRD